MWMDSDGEKKGPIHRTKVCQQNSTYDAYSSSDCLGGRATFEKLLERVTSDVYVF